MENSRPKEFRAWDKKLKKMYNNFPNFNEHEIRVFYPDDCEVLEYTGLKDKNGKKIFEGDKVLITNPDDQIQKIQIIGTVFFDLGAFGVIITDVKQWDNYQVPPPKEGHHFWFLHLICSRIYEIIGNIHEDNKAGE